MTHEDYVTYEQAGKLKELGFNWPCNHFYCKPKDKEVRLVCYVQMDFLDEQYHNFNDPSIWTSGADISFSAPTLSQVQKWLREKEIFLFISNDNDAEVNGRTQFHWWITDKLGRPFLYGEGDDAKLLRCESYYDTYEQALSAGIDKVIEILKKENNGK